MIVAGDGPRAPDREPRDGAGSPPGTGPHRRRAPAPPDAGVRALLRPARCPSLRARCRGREATWRARREGLRATRHPRGGSGSGKPRTGPPGERTAPSKHGRSSPHRRTRARGVRSDTPPVGRRRRAGGTGGRRGPHGERGDPSGPHREASGPSATAPWGELAVGAPTHADAGGAAPLRGTLSSPRRRARAPARRSGPAWPRRSPGCRPATPGRPDAARRSRSGWRR